tara:strand:+ start:140 stop:526 length:387 start_codon:yes stop_codon:yes gene_type:complete
MISKETLESLRVGLEKQFRKRDIREQKVFLEELEIRYVENEEDLYAKVLADNITEYVKLRSIRVRDIKELKLEDKYEVVNEMIDGKREKELKEKVQIIKEKEQKKPIKDPIKDPIKKPGIPIVPPKKP